MLMKVGHRSGALRNSSNMFSFSVHHMMPTDKILWTIGSKFFPIHSEAFLGSNVSLIMSLYSF